MMIRAEEIMPLYRHSAERSALSIEVFSEEADVSIFGQTASSWA